jgi:hypothetical protein
MIYGLQEIKSVVRVPILMSWVRMQPSVLPETISYWVTCNEVTLSFGSSRIWIGAREFDLYMSIKIISDEQEIISIDYL